MSHVASVEVTITDLNALKEACKALGWKFLEGQKTYRWYGTWVDDSPVPDHLFSPAETARIRAMSREDRRKFMTDYLGKCDHAISVPGAGYQIGLRSRGDGTFSVAFDWYQQRTLLDALGGQKAPKLVQAYSSEKVKMDARRYGHIIEAEDRLADGTIRLRIDAGRYA